MASPATDLFVAIDDGGPIVGTLTLAMFRIPTGMRAWIEDVVVDEAGRGQGVGDGLTDAAVEQARAPGAARSTSRPARRARRPTASTSASGSSSARRTSTASTSPI